MKISKKKGIKSLKVQKLSIRKVEITRSSGKNYQKLLWKLPIIMGKVIREYDKKLPTIKEKVTRTYGENYQQEW